MEWNKNVLVTGAGGFIGSHLVEKLVHLGADVTCFVEYNSNNSWENLEHLPEDIKTKIKVVLGNFNDFESINQATQGQDLVFHLGALIAIPYSYVNPRAFFKTNVLGTFNVMQAALVNKIEKVVHTSTSEVYGTPKYVPINESHPLQGQSPYSASKIASDKVAESFFNAFGLPVATLRPFNTFGPRQSARAIIPSVISQAISGKNINFGSGHPTRDFTYVTDAVNGFIKIMESPYSVGEVINIGSSKEISIKELMQVIIDKVGNNVELIHDPSRVRPAKSEVLRLCADTLVAKRLINWEPEVSLGDGIERTIDWVKQNMNLFKINRYNI